MNARERVKLLHGPYRPLAVRPGDHAVCLFRDCDVVVTSWTDARIPWPRCRAVESHGGGSGLLVDEELARAIRNESAAAIRYWWGVSSKAVWHWRRALAVGRKDNEGTRRLDLASAAGGGKASQERGVTPDEIEHRRQLARNGHYRPTGRWKGKEWSQEQLALLGTGPDEVIAAKIGRTANAVRIERNRRGIPTANDRRQVEPVSASGRERSP